MKPSGLGQLLSDKQEETLVVIVQEWLAEAGRRLAKTSKTAYLDAQVLLARHLNRPRAWLLAHPAASLRPEQITALESKLLRLEKKEPLAYVIGVWEFYGLELEIGPSVLVPRPETEILVEEALSWLRSHPGRRAVADIGTGSGCIAIALASNAASLFVVASDISAYALEVARRNVTKYHLQETVKLVQADLLIEDVNRPFDLVCANLPYIPSGMLETLAVQKHEPILALDGGEDGLCVIRRLLDRLPGLLASGGLALLEIEADQGVAALELAREKFGTAEITILPDLAGHDRILKIQTC